MTEESNLQRRVEKLEADLINAKQLAAEGIKAERLEVGQLSPYSIFDKHGAIAIVFAIFIQTAGAIWWAASLSGQVNEIRESNRRQDDVIGVMSRTIQENAERLTRVQSVQENVVKILDRFQNEFNKRGPQ